MIIGGLSIMVYAADGDDSFITTRDLFLAFHIQRVTEKGNDVQQQISGESVQ